MKLIFIDEVCGAKDVNSFGLCAVIIDSTKYKSIYEEFIKTLHQNNWPLEAELKGNYLFSNDPQSTGKRPSEMVDLVKSIINHLSSKTNSRCDVYFAYNHNRQSFDNYEILLRSIINKITKAPNGAGKNIATIYLDSWNQIENKKNKQHLDEVAEMAMVNRGYNLVESQVTIISSRNSAVGVCYADIVAYILRWIIENPKKFSMARQPSLFDLYEDDVKTEILQKKIDTTRELAETIKKFKIIKS